MKPHIERVIVSDVVESTSGISRRDFIAGGLSAMATFYELAGEAEARHSGLDEAAYYRHDQTAHHAPIEKALNITPGTAADNYNSASFAASRRTNIGAFVIWAPEMTAWQPARGEFDETVWDSAGANMASAAGLKTYVAVPSEYPHWLLPAKNHAPKYRGPNSPWAHYMLRIMQEFPNVDGLIFANEPNFAFCKDRHSAKHTAEMMMTVNDLMRHTGYDKLLLGPAIADGVPDYGVSYMKKFIEELRQLRRGFDVPAGLAYHTYKGVKHDDIRGVRGVSKLAQDAWIGSERGVYLSELGYEFLTHETSSKHVYAYDSSLPRQEMMQKHNLISFFRKCQAIGNVALFANYTYQDTPYGGGGFMSGLVRYDGKPHPVLPIWSNLTSA